ncbi:MAG: pilus assembly PilX N-terminal domain-containing protein [Phycisphaerales bacterium]|nr:MAG: pilus assembly PilX N-terminal domain-containing protein [Phycisphaerales bacterium]
MARLKNRKGTALILSLILVVVFSVLAISLATQSSANVQIAFNQHKVSRAFANAESGLEVVRYWLSRVIVPRSTSESAYFDAIVDYVQNDLETSGIGGIVLYDDGGVPAISLASTATSNFEAQISSVAGNSDIVQVDVTGRFEDITRTLRVNFTLEPYEHPIFNFGLATKGPLNLPGNPTLIGANANWEADVYVESSTSNTAVYVGGNTNFDGDVSIGNPDADAKFVGDVLIAGDQGQAAIDNHVFRGVDPTDFPVPDTAHFRQYATGDIVDSSTDLTGGMTLNNATIVAGTNPTFASSVVVQGILLIESPNVVTFGRNIELRGIIVAEGSLECPGDDKITFCGNFGTAPYPAGSEFDAIRQETGSSIVAPGFAASFQGNFSTLDGVMAVSGVHFSGNSNAIVKGTIINYSDEAAVVEGNASMQFDRLNSTKIPSGFDTHRVLSYEPSSYAVIK